MIAHAFPEGVVSSAPLRCSGRSARRSTLLAFAATGLASLLDTPVLFPCNVIVQELGPKQTEVAAIDPVASMQATENPKLPQMAREVRTRLGRVIENHTAEHRSRAPLP